MNTTLQPIFMIYLYDILVNCKLGRHDNRWGSHTWSHEREGLQQEQLNILSLLSLYKAKKRQEFYTPETLQTWLCMMVCSNSSWSLTVVSLSSSLCFTRCVVRSVADILQLDAFWLSFMLASVDVETFLWRPKETLVSDLTPCRLFFILCPWNVTQITTIITNILCALMFLYAF